jgi:hypothetical protein
MKRTLFTLCAVMLCGTLPSCISLTAEIGLPGNGTPGGLSGKIGGTWSWPLLKSEEPALITTEEAYNMVANGPGKNPVLPMP